MDSFAPRTTCVLFITALAVFCLFGTKANAQEGSVIYTGKIVDRGSGEPVAYATVMIGDLSTQQAITGVTTLEDGTFSLETNAGDHYIEISFIGFEKVVLQPPALQNGIVDLGTVEMSEDAQQLEEVVVEGEVSQTVFKLDKGCSTWERTLAVQGPVH